MKEKRFYIAYGSNLSVEQMAYRCPDAEIAGMAALKESRKRSSTKTGGTLSAMRSAGDRGGNG